MISYSEDIKAPSARKRWTKKESVKRIVTSSPVDILINEADKSNKTDQPIIYFNKYIMPAQPEAYIKCRRYDFF